MSSKIRIRPVGKADFDQWHALWEGYNAFYKREGPTAISDTVTQTTWERFLDASEPVHALVAERGDVLLGLVHFIYHRNTTMIQTTCYLQDLFTAPSERGKGVGRQLVQAVYDAAKAAGAERVYWHTHETNKTAMQLYDKIAENSGFILYRQTL